MIPLFRLLSSTTHNTERRVRVRRQLVSRGWTSQALSVAQLHDFSKAVIAPGEYVRFLRDATTKKAAEAVLRDLATGADAGTGVSRSRITVSQFLADWSETIEPRVRETRWVSYRDNRRSWQVTIRGGAA